MFTKTVKLNKYSFDVDVNRKGNKNEIFKNHINKISEETERRKFLKTNLRTK